MAPTAPQPQNPEIPRREQQTSPPSLVEAKTLEIAAELNQRFANPNAPDKFTLDEVAELLQSDPAPVVHAMVDSTILEDTSAFEWTSTKVRNGSKLFTQDEVRALNLHPMVRTLNSGQVKEILGLGSQKELGELAKKHGIKPVKPVKNRPYYGTFNLDQIEEFKVALHPEGAHTVDKVEQRRNEVRKKLELFFADPDAPETFEVSEVAKLLETDAFPLVRAIQQKAYFELPERADLAYAEIFRHKRKYTVSQAEVLELNEHEYVRTVSIKDIADELNCSREMISQICVDDDIAPLVQYGTGKSKTQGKSGGYFDLNQVDDFREKIKRFDAQADDIALKGLQERFKHLTRGRLEHAATAVGVAIRWKRDPVHGGQAEYVEKDGLQRVLRFLVDQKGLR